MFKPFTHAQGSLKFCRGFTNNKRGSAVFITSKANFKAVIPKLFTYINYPRKSSDKPPICMPEILFGAVFPLTFFIYKHLTRERFELSQIVRQFKPKVALIFSLTAVWTNSASVSKSNAKSLGTVYRNSNYVCISEM